MEHARVVPTKNISTDPYVLQRFFKEFANVLKELGHPIHGGMLSFSQMSNDPTFKLIGAVLITGGYVKKSIMFEEESDSRELKIWRILEGEQRDGVHSDNLRTFLAAIMKISVEDSADSQEEYGEFAEDGTYHISPAQIKRVHKEFINCFTNRCAFMPRLSKDKENSQPSFSPVLCEQSVKIANRARVEGDRVSHTQMLIKVKEQQQKY